MPSTKPTQAEPARMPDSARPRLAAALRLTFDEVRGQHVLLGPESVRVLNPTGAAILQLCDGRRDLGGIVAQLQERFAGAEPGEVRAFLGHLAAKRCVEIDDD
ncbi:pyrroloquinoline quinone biosynthesis peptide chaperone PqqD [Saccharopolyspora mangrovi]|uniref:Pyrroloquinoline quinone biosynthesis peptide chaperone PqqD n=1 Tax=Saccharopolyspora mangrovi TaxID=3082379 RepID=A0ABU6A4U6_9PSEU|nr:pyrroloquinoline quinone biosynthesis peptide chaperone PqqD [Saccharopolyspora sp. S2-29]MEB3366486.1 pyrroloquinoline quinone biosynthesis peptide chaperone PqqD [Saccharopolyspora sp. S2-29]